MILVYVAIIPDIEYTGYYDLKHILFQILNRSRFLMKYLFQEMPIAAIRSKV